MPSTELLLLGTSGGPRWRTSRTGISSAVKVGNESYVVDTGYGSSRQFKLNGLDIGHLRAILLTHLHSDHTIDLASFLLFGWFDGLESKRGERTKVLGPGRRGSLAPWSGHLGAEPPVLFPERPDAGTVDMWRSILSGHASDLNDRVRDNGRPLPEELFEVSDIRLPISADAAHSYSPDMEPFRVYIDDQVDVHAILVSHAPVFPALAFRFDTQAGSITFSGDTAPCSNLVRLAGGSDVLVHEVIDERWLERQYDGGKRPADRALMDHQLTAHTTVEQVGVVAQKAGVSTLVLSHVVPGDGDDRNFSRAGSNFDGKLLVGRDGMRVSL